LPPDLPPREPAHAEAGERNVGEEPAPQRLQIEASNAALSNWQSELLQQVLLQERY
jgi:hypothetical protein